MTTPLLTFSTLYPNARQPGHGSFVETRLRALTKGRDYTTRVLAPVPWFPFKASVFGAYGKYAGVPAYEEREGIPVWHPRYAVIPKVGMNLAPSLLYRSAVTSQHLWACDDFHPAIIDAHYFFPDGVAAARLAETLDVPLIITARGSDINLISRYARPLAQMRAAAQRCQAIIAVSAALAEKMAELGFDENNITVLRNGVDAQVFRPADRQALRTRMRLDGRVLLSAGNLVRLKGHDLAIEALATLPDTTLLIAGDGPLMGKLQAQAQALGVQERVRFLGRTTQAHLVELYNAADMLVLASSREGLANVLLESIACGTPAIATAVGGNAEVICDPRAGVLMNERSVAGIIDALRRLEATGISRTETRDFAGNFSWQDTCHKLDLLIQRIL